MAVWQMQMKQNWQGKGGKGGMMGGMGMTTHNPAKYKTQLCMHWMQGTCTRAASCTFAHGEHEMQGGFSQKGQGKTSYNGNSYNSGTSYGHAPKGLSKSAPKGIMASAKGTMRATGPVPVGKTGGKGKVNPMSMMKGFMKGKGKGKGTKGAGHKLPRTRISEIPVLGEVVEWKGKYGWIQPSEVIEHEKAHLRNGKIFVSLEDLVGIEELSPGRVVQFQLFSDASGLGAEECMQA
ncbi:unnamed protein product [Effrenium voratum]|uniref:C3H1-type domain-containing protein n=1 Tax=Effrenium voratum TaxID=2562239 RepID=A0AA36IC84_9DINO|nr:unnamed protein product [Effrenium voratum]